MKKLFNFIFLFIFSSLFLSSNAFAANLFLSTDTDKIKTGEAFISTLYLDTDGESINTIEGDLQYDEKLIQAEALNIGGSFISFWVEKPDIKTPGIIHFSGITPGGISTSKSEVLSVVFRAQKEGDTNLVLNNVNLFLNDGEGTKTLAKVSNANIKITEGINDTLLPVVIKDEIPPEEFATTRTRDQSIYDNKYFVVFSTVDKGSGVDHYEVCELFKCVSASSPFLLKNQTPFYHVAVKAYDINGNTRESSITSPWLIILVFLLFVVIIYLCFYWRKNLTRK